QACSVRSRAQRRVLLSLIDKCHRQDGDLVMNSTTLLGGQHRRGEGVAKVGEPSLSLRARDGQQVVAMLERHVGAIAVAALTGEPSGEEALLRSALVGEITAEEWPQRRVGRNPVVEPVYERLDRGRASNASEDIATDESAVRLWMGKESTVLHRALVSA